MGATFGHPPAEGPGTYARERDPGRGSATSHQVPKSGPAGWAIPPDPQKARGGEIPDQGGPEVPAPILIA